MDESIRDRMLNFLASHNVMTLATVRPDGFPQATMVYYVHSDLTIYFATDPGSQKAGNIGLNSKVSVAIAGQTERAYKLQACYLSGTAKRLTDPRLVHSTQLMLFQAVSEAKRFSPADPKQLAVYSITPVAISLVDFEYGYGKTFQIEL
jgi:nitroimidazol reductase NimA-like FMN-containing flavoprotein (pyridoxamine 5'-phosphate oxidase superfamily)